MIDTPENGLQTFCERLHEQSWQVVLVRRVGEIIESSHNRYMVLHKMKGLVFADCSIVCAKKVNDDLEAFLPLIGHCDDEDTTDFKRMPV